MLKDNPTLLWRNLYWFQAFFSSLTFSPVFSLGILCAVFSVKSEVWDLLHNITLKVVFVVSCCKQPGRWTEAIEPLIVVTVVFGQESHVI